MSALPKPVLRGHIKRRGIKGLIGAVTVAIFNGAMYHFFVGKPRREAYEEFVRTYDEQAHYKDLVKYGYITINVLKDEIQAARS